jgi:hypothetical protein
LPGILRGSSSRAASLVLGRTASPSSTSAQ